MIALAGRVAGATAAVFVGGRRTGSAVLVGPRVLITAGHVVRKPGAVEVAFPHSAGGEARVPVLPSPGDIDAAVLAVEGDLPDWWPGAAEVAPARRLPATVAVLGFPQQERAARGVWREFAVSGPVTGDTVQLDWTQAAGTLPGHSGGPVIDPATGQVVGVLVEGSAEGRFDRFVPAATIARRWPEVPVRWLMAGDEARSHFERRSRGQRSRARGGDLFRGRHTALATVGAWLTSDRSPGRPLVITGQPGAGKSSVLARAVLDHEHLAGVAFHARGARHADLLAALADLVGVDADDEDALLEALETDRVVVAVDALDEAAGDADRRAIAATLAELARLDPVRVVVATRPLGARHTPGSLFKVLGVAGPTLIDLDTDRYFEPAGLQQFAAAVLSQEGTRRPGPPDAAWTRYRADPDLLDRLAGVIAARAGRNYLVAAMAAVALSEADDPVDPADPDFAESSIPAEVGEALGKYLQTLPDGEQIRIRGSLSALAYARGSGIDDPTWLAFAAALGFPATVGDLEQLRRSAAADFLLHTTTDADRPVTRLFHQALIDELRADRHEPTDEQAVLGRLRATGWTDPYARTFAADHARACGHLAALVQDAAFVVHADLGRLLTLLSDPPPDVPAATLAVLRRCGARASDLPPGRRARLLALTAAHLGLPHQLRAYAEVCGEPFVPEWAHSLGTPHRELVGHTSTVSAVAIGEHAGRIVIVSGSYDCTVRIWDAATGQPVGDPLDDDSGAISAAAVARVEGRTVVATGDLDGAVRVWDLETGQPSDGLRSEYVEKLWKGTDPFPPAVAYPSPEHAGPVTSVAYGEVDGRAVLVSGGEDGTVLVRDAATGRPVGQPLAGHTGPVNAVAVGTAGGRAVIASGGADHTVRIWDAVTGRPVGDPLIGDGDVVEAVAVGRFDGRAVVVSGGWDDTVRIWDAVTGQPVGDPLIGHGGIVEAVAVGRFDGRAVVVSGGWDDAVRLWDAATGQPVGEPLAGHGDHVRAVAVGTLDGGTVVVSGGDDHTVRIWDPAATGSVGHPQVGHTGRVSVVAVARVDGRDVVVSGGHDATVRMWDAATGLPVGDPLAGHDSLVQGVGVAQAGARTVIVSGAWDESVVAWDAHTREPTGAPRPSHHGVVATGSLNGRVIAAGGTDDRMVEVWDVDTGVPIYDPLAGHTNEVSAVAIGSLDGRVVIVSGSYDGSVRIWDAATGLPAAVSIDHDSMVESVAIGQMGERGVVVSGGWDGIVRVWDPGTGRMIGAPFEDHTGTVNSVAVGVLDGQPVIVSGGDDDTVRIWDPSGREPVVIDLLHAVTGLALDSRNNRLVICGATAISGLVAR